MVTWLQQHVLVNMNMNMCVTGIQNVLKVQPETGSESYTVNAISI